MTNKTPGNNLTLTLMGQQQEPKACWVSGTYQSQMGPKMRAPTRSPAMNTDCEVLFRFFRSHTRSN